MSFTPRVAAPVGRLFSTASEQITKLTTKEDELKHRIQNQIRSLVSSVETLNKTRMSRQNIELLELKKSVLQNRIDELARNISHKEFLYPEEPAVQEQAQLAILKQRLALLSNKKRKD